MPLRLAVRGLNPHVGLRGEVVEKSHGFIDLTSKCTDVSLTARSPVTRIPARYSVCLSSDPTKLCKRAV